MYEHKMYNGKKCIGTYQGICKTSKDSAFVALVFFNQVVDVWSIEKETTPFEINVHSEKAIDELRRYYKECHDDAKVEIQVYKRV